MMSADHPTGGNSPSGEMDAICKVTPIARASIEVATACKASFPTENSEAGSSASSPRALARISFMQSKIIFPPISASKMNETHDEAASNTSRKAPAISPVKAYPMRGITA